MARGRAYGDFSSQTKRVLALRVGERCSRPGCTRVTSAPHSNSSKVLRVGKACHIYAASDNGPRGNPNLTPEQRKDPSNGIWLCSVCHDTIDGDAERYPAPLLLQWKKEAEQRQDRRFLEHPSELVDYWLSEVQWVETLLDEYKPSSCLNHLERLEPRYWEMASNELKQKTLRLRGRAMLALHQFEDGANLLAQSSEFAPDTLLGKCDLAHSHYILERPDDAERIAREALEIDSSAGRARGLVIASQAAQRTYEEIVDDLPSDWASTFDVTYALGACALSQDCLDEAVQWFARASSLNSDVNVDLLGHYAEALFEKVKRVSPIFPGCPLTEEERGTLRSAVAMFREAWDAVSDTEVAKVHMRWLSCAVTILFALGEYETARVLVDEGLRDDPRNETLIQQKAMVLLGSGQELEGEYLLRDALRGRESASILGLLAVCLLNRGETLELPELLDRLCALDLDADEREQATSLRLLHYVNTDNVEGAKLILNALSVDERKKPVFQVCEARLLLLSGSRGAADHKLRELALEAAKWPPIQQLEFADTCHRAGLFAEAIPFFARNVSLEQDSSTLRQLLECHVKVGNKNKAFEIAQSVRQRLGPLHLVTRYEASIYEEIGDLPNCATVLDLYTRAFPDQHDVKLWLADILLRLGRTDDVDNILAQDLTWQTLPATHICYLAQLLSRRGRSSDALDILYQARRDPRLRRSSSRIHLSYLLTFMHVEQKETFHISEAGRGTSVRFSETEENPWRTILRDGEVPLGDWEFPPDSWIARKLEGKKVGDKILLRESPSREEGEHSLLLVYSVAFGDTLGARTAPRTCFFMYSRNTSSNVPL
jgi:tetratricopeptide (TPR) repeat protein